MMGAQRTERSCVRAPMLIRTNAAKPVPLSSRPTADAFGSQLWCAEKKALWPVQLRYRGDPVVALSDNRHEFSPSPSESRHHSPYWDLGRLSNFSIIQAFEISEHKCLPKRHWQGGDCCSKLLSIGFRDERRLWRFNLDFHGLCPFKLNSLQIFDSHHRGRPVLTKPRIRRVPDDTEHPGPRVSSRIFANSAERAQGRVLHHILGV